MRFENFSKNYTFWKIIYTTQQQQVIKFANTWHFWQLPLTIDVGSFNIWHFPVEAHKHLYGKLLHVAFLGWNT